MMWNNSTRNIRWYGVQKVCPPSLYWFWNLVQQFIWRRRYLPVMNKVNCQYIFSVLRVAFIPSQVGQCCKLLSAIVTADWKWCIFLLNYQHNKLVWSKRKDLNDYNNLTVHLALVCTLGFVSILLSLNTDHSGILQLVVTLVPWIYSTAKLTERRNKGDVHVGTLRCCSRCQPSVN